MSDFLEQTIPRSISVNEPFGKLIYEGMGNFSVFRDLIDGELSERYLNSRNLSKKKPFFFACYFHDIYKSEECYINIYFYQYDNGFVFYCKYTFIANKKDFSSEIDLSIEDLIKLLIERRQKMV